MIVYIHSIIFLISELVKLDVQSGEINAEIKKGCLFLFPTIDSRRITKERTVLSNKLLLSSNFAHKIDPSEVRKTPKGRVSSSISATVIAILLEFYSTERYTSRISLTD